MHSSPLVTETEVPLLEKRVLIIEDEAVFAGAVRKRLQRAGYNAEIAGNLEQGAASINETTPDLVLLDMNMPIMNGDEVAIKMRQAEFTGPILALTAATDQESVDTMMNAGCDGFIRKPIDFQTLMHQVKEVSDLKL